jgi:hypothetical protein
MEHRPLHDHPLRQALMANEPSAVSRLFYRSAQRACGVFRQRIRKLRE